MYNMEMNFSDKVQLNSYLSFEFLACFKNQIK